MLSAIAAALALALGVYNFIESKRAPQRARQTALWDELRSLIEPLPPMLKDARATLSNGGDVPGAPGELRFVEKRLREIAPRFDRDERELWVRLGLLELTLGRVSGAWRDAEWSQQSVDDYSEKLDRARKRVTEYASVADHESAREIASRLRDAKHRELSDRIDEALARLSGWKATLDAMDRGKRLNPPG